VVSDIFSLLPLISDVVSFVSKHLKKYDIEDLSSPEKRKEAAKYFARKGEKYIGDIISYYSRIDDKEYLENNVLSEMELKGGLYRKILEFLSNRSDWKTRYVALIIARKAKTSENGDIMKKIKNISKSDNNEKNRIQAYNYLHEKLSEESLDYLLWGIENDSQENVRLNCIERITETNKNDEKIADRIGAWFKKERNNRRVAEKLIEMCGELRIRESFGELIGFLGDDNRTISKQAAISLLKICNTNALDPINEKCLSIDDIAYRHSIIDAFEYKKKSSKAKTILEEYLEEHPDERGVVYRVLAKFYENGSRYHGSN
jgi:hypothetical protein